MAGLNFDLGAFSPKDLLARGRFVLSIGDEAVVLTLVEGRQVTDAWVASPDPAEGAADILEALSTRRRFPVSVLIDAFEQVFREEKVPRVGFLDQKKVIQRHLQMAFPGNNLQGALSHGTDPSGNSYYLFCSVPPTEQVKGWLQVLKKAGRKPAGIHMLPLESLEMLRNLTPATSTTGGVRWRMMFAFDMTAGLRQIVAKQSRIVLTRLTPPPPPDSDIEPTTVIERDFSQTLSYVKRMGYRKGDNLDVVILAEEPLSSELRAMEWDEAHTVTILSPHEAGEPLALGKVGQAGQPYADVLHALWFATRQKPALTLRWTQEEKVDYQRIAAQALPAVAVLSGFLLLAWAGSLSWQIFETIGLIDRQELELERTQTVLRVEQEKLDELPYRAEALRPVIAVLDEVSRGDVHPIPIFARLNHALSGGSLISQIILTTPQPEATDRRRSQSQPQQPAIDYRLEFTVELPPDTAGDAQAIQRTDELQAALLGAFGEGHVINILRPPVAIRPDQILRGGTTGVPAATGGPEQRTSYTVVYEVVKNAAPGAGKGTS